MKKVPVSSVFDVLSSFRSYFQEEKELPDYGIEEPFHSELYSSDRMNNHGKIIAGSHKLLTNMRPADQLLARLDSNEEILLKVRNLLVENIKAGKIITPGAEWLLDNFYLIEEQIVLARKHLPKGYSEGLPYLENGIMAGMPRVYNIVLEIISHSDGRVDINNLSSFIAAYQTDTLLTIGELWAIPIMLRLAVIENLRRVCSRIALDMIDNNLADYWSNRMIATVQDQPGDLVLTISDMARSKLVLSNPFVAAFTKNLQGKGPALALPLSWMEQQLVRTGSGSNEMVRMENQKQAADQVSVRNSIGTLRFIGATDWREFVETLSGIEQILRQDPAGTYPLMDFATRDRYRHVVESIAKNSLLSETEVAGKVLEQASYSKNSAGPFNRQAHVGYYLIGKGRMQTESLAFVRYTLRHRLSRMIGSQPVFLYLASIFFFTCITAAIMYSVGAGADINSWLFLALVGLLCFSGAAQLAVALVNWVATILIQPQLLPRMDFSKGIPIEYRTLIIVPTMLSGKKYIEDLIQDLEIRFLANKEPNLYYGLLTDFVDADKETLNEDKGLLTLASSYIDELNQKYRETEDDIFFLFHRPRLWNKAEKKWMGYERKRGKLSALNALLRDKDTGQFSSITGNYELLRNIKYVITLDSDTQLPREAAWKFVATMAHPLNHAVYNHRKRRVTEGYGILQPRVDSAIPQTATSLYLRMQGDVSGIDPYTQVSSDVYQDLFGEGSFIGKGIYDIDVFEQALANVFPENRILSHDLLEGCYARSGLLSDVYLYEDNPAQYSADVKRHHRWIRGDWQIGAWMLPFVTLGNGRFAFNKLSVLSKWKIFDNLRRSVLPLSLLLLLLLGWTVLPHSWFWTAAVTVIVLLPVMLASGWQLVNKPRDLTLNAHLAEIGISVRNTLLRFIFNLAILPYQAYKYADAIVRTKWRMLISRKKLLQWTPSANTTNNNDDSIWSSYKSLWIAPLLAIICGMYLFASIPAILVAAPILALWLMAPAIVWLLSKPEKEESTVLLEGQVRFLHKTARKTWSYFEQFVTAEDNWLPPDNFQEHPAAIVAHRTSPTNIGLALLSNLTAYDFGYISGGMLVSRCSNTLQTMQQLERYNGHFYNWYDTVTLAPLRPKYVSTVDSGNLAGHLLTLKQGLLELTDKPVLTSQLYEGLRTTVHVLEDIQKNKLFTDRLLARIELAINTPFTFSNIKSLLVDLLTIANELATAGDDIAPPASGWISRLVKQITDIDNDLMVLAPWAGGPGVPERFTHLLSIDNVPSLSMLAAMSGIYSSVIEEYERNDSSSEEVEWLSQMRLYLLVASENAEERIVQIDRIAKQCELFSQLEYDFLFDIPTALLRIGYNVDEGRKDNSFYDLLASEARLGIFVGIAQGKLPQESWFSLGRLLTNSAGDPILLSWSGSMFEYLMPQLVMPSYENTLLYQTSRATVKRQIEYAAQQGKPWGISESAYNTVDANLNYQYRAFGVPGLGLKRGLEEDMVIAPYASMMALMVLPAKACANLQLLSEEGFEGEYGFYEAIDYTPARVPRGKAHSIIQSYMVHHQGMGFLSLAYHLFSKPMQQRFASELRFQATLLLLQERIPRATVFYAHTADLVHNYATSAEAPVRNITTPNTPIPEVQLLGNARYHVMVTNGGGGYSRWKDIAVTRWREDVTKDDYGIFCYIKDVQTGNTWSNTHQPTLWPARSYEAIFSQGHAEYRRHDEGIDTMTEIVISPEDDTEMRRIRISNKSSSVRVLDITSYAEVVMARQASDEAHPAFSNLFVQTQILPDTKAILCTRRARSEDEQPPWVVHLMNVRGVVVEDISYETDRMKFIGRGRNLTNPLANEEDLLSGSQGSVLDPILSIRYRIALKPGQTAIIDLIYGIAETKEGCESLMYKYHDQHLKSRAFELSWTHSQVLLRQINATAADTQLYDSLAASVIYANPVFRADTATVRSNFRGQSALWSHSVSGDLPIVLLHIYDTENLEIVRQMVQAHAYWRLKGLTVDLVIWNEDHGSYRQVLQEQIMGLITSVTGVQGSNNSGNIFVRSADQVSSEDRILFESVARIIISDNKGTLAEQINRHSNIRNLMPVLETKPAVGEERQLAIVLPADLVFFNGTGGFTQDGKEYKIVVDKEHNTPVPWANVIANPNFGSVVSESGSAYTWAINAHEYRLTPWSNDPVSDAGGEAFYLRDEETGHFWSPAPFPLQGRNAYIVTHGFGYSKWEHIEQNIATELCVFVDTELAVKFVKLKIRNDSGRKRTLSATGFLEIILGDVRAKTNMHILSEYDPATGSLLFKNRYNTVFAERSSFFRIDEMDNVSFTTDRAEFIGRNKNLTDPQVMHHKKLSGKTGACLDTCAAIQAKFDLPDGEEKEIIFQLGSAENHDKTQALISQISKPGAADNSLKAVQEYWQETLGYVQVSTPDTALNVLANGWLMYQTIASRIFARSGFYQSGGAFGFRDQLQDTLALLHARPELARKQILLNASRQFAEGDVQHWWHPPEGRGVRTHCSDDMLWLPFAVSRYVKVTGDKAILNESAGFLESRLLHQDEDSLYDLPVSGNLSGTLYEHCMRAIQISLRYGRHGLPLIGSGDWNDGMDRVGHKGQGESVWLGYFLYDVLLKFAKVADGFDDDSFSAFCRKEAEGLRSNIETSCWDGQWYIRAYFDDGTALGSRENNECRIDAIAQSWSVFSGAADAKRAALAMASLDKYLVNRDLRLIQLLDPPFDSTDGLNPGYIKGYVPGVRENGGQYSHAAIWAVMAFAALGNRTKVWELFSMIHPIGHALDAANVAVYKTEPYVMAADVYANESHKGRGGWTWYTGSAGWMYQFIISSLLGVELEDGKLIFKPCFPLDWPSVAISYRYGSATYNITVFQLSNRIGSSWKIDDLGGEGNIVPLVDDSMTHKLEVYISVDEV